MIVCMIDGVDCGVHNVICSNGYEMPSSYICDGDDDCGDGTDESGCGK